MSGHKSLHKTFLVVKPLLWSVPFQNNLLI